MSCLIYYFGPALWLIKYKRTLTIVVWYDLTIVSNDYCCVV